jgi:hypothetical protein
MLLSVGRGSGVTVMFTVTADNVTDSQEKCNTAKNV